MKTGVADKTDVSYSSHKERLNELLHDKGYRVVGLYPSGGFANLIMKLYDSLFDKPNIKWLQFNSNPKIWGEMSNGLPIYSPDAIESLHPDSIIICSYKYGDEIYESIKRFEDIGINISKLHQDTDMMWVI